MSVESLDLVRPCGPMDKASDFESEDCGFDPHRGHFLDNLSFYIILQLKLMVVR